jgi:hypothetical protein
MFEKDPYCEVYLAMFAKADEVASKLSQRRARNGGQSSQVQQASWSLPSPDRNTVELKPPVLSPRLVQIERR